MNTFKTRSSSRKNVITVICTFLPMMLLACLGLKVAVATWIFLEAVLLLTGGFCLLLVARTRWEIVFQGGTIHLYNTGNRQSYCVENLTRSELLIKQSASQKGRDCCDLVIVDCPFRMYDVQKCEALRRYIGQNFPL